METSLKPGFAQIFSCCPKNPSCPKFGGAAAPLAPRPVRLCPYFHYLSEDIMTNLSPQEQTAKVAGNEFIMGARTNCYK